jgi:hypothetical protein
MGMGKRNKAPRWMVREVHDLFEEQERVEKINVARKASKLKRQTERQKARLQKLEERKY